MRIRIIFLMAIILLASCNSGIDSTTYSEFQKKGNEVSEQAQGALLKNVAKAIQKGGPQYAIEFCNLEASSIVDSLNQVFNCTISRVSANNRNPKAGLSSAEMRKLWNIFQEGELTDTIIRHKNEFVFYKPIKIAMPACLKCHGNLETDINVSTKQKLQELYPEDLATGYALNDFRGLWRIEFEE